MWSAYTVNLAAGAGPYSGTNRGLPVYKRRRWKSGASRVGYIFEFHGPYMGEIVEHAYLTGEDNVPLRHKQSANMIYADGHLGYIPTDGFATRADIPWEWE
ncbi:MAG: hypothetical protein KGZ25_00375 [Planctomycetes bacterium]|nr:hypothetical protein [Planctomycetota bacterium]